MLEVKDLEVCYGAALALRSVSLRVEDGEIVALVGSNGAGKTTFLKTVARLAIPSRGLVVWNGQNLLTRPPCEIVRLGLALVPEGRRVFPYMTVLDNLLVGAHSLSKPRLVDDSLNYVFRLFPILRERRFQQAGTLSGGQQQALAIARGLMARPRLLMLDEPSLGLDPIMVGRVFGALKEINEDGVAVLLVEQKIDRALSLSNRAYVLENGAIVAYGKSEELLNDDRIRSAYLGL